MEDNSKASQKGIHFSKQNLDLIKKIESVSSLAETVKGSFEKTVSEVMEILMGGAIRLGASDIHVEAMQDKAKLRARIDGILQDVAEIDRKIYETLVSRMKLLSGIKLNISDRPQDGRFSVFMEDDGLPIEIRSSTLPAEYGEAVVLRILNPKSLISLKELGLREDLFFLFQKEIKKPNGMIIITGPTGSGKTTTLYAFLKEIQSPEIKIITIEDPIEYHLNGISQTQVNPTGGYDFASGLQSIMRQDPDVILVGEIRDSKTAQIAIQAALTGHLVFSTLHTNDAAGTISRLLSLEGDIKNIGPAVNLAVAQRLVREVCSECKEMITISPTDLKKIKTHLPEKILDKYKVSEKTKIPKAKGCKKCNLTGYKGRVGIFETIIFDEKMEKLILENPSVAEFKEEAVKAGMITMKQDGLIKVLEGKTTIEEVERVTGEE
jgi:type II secretory ATPase GspE/PulE/Tfp pilus assembly ATPase PilB-like protein